MGPLYRMLGLSTGTADRAPEPAERRAAYLCDVAYCTNKDLAFDYMRDRLDAGRRGGTLGRKAAALRTGRRRDENAPGFLRGLHFAIVDEVDSVLIDESRTPLILSGTAPSLHDPALFDAALDIARSLRPASTSRPDRASGVSNCCPKGGRR